MNLKQKNLVGIRNFFYKAILLLGVVLAPTSCCLFSKLPKYEEVVVNGKKQLVPKSLLDELPDLNQRKIPIRTNKNLQAKVLQKR